MRCDQTAHLTLDLDIALPVLRWDRPLGDDLPQWRNTYVARLEERLQARQAADPGFSTVLQALAFLTPSRRTRFLTTPTVSNILLQDEATGDLSAGGAAEAELAFLAGSAMAELMAAGLTDPGDAPRWTARGTPVAGRPAADGSPSGPADRGGALDDHLLAGTDIHLDVDSPFAFPDDDFGLASTRPYEKPELRAALDGLLEAVQIVSLLPSASEYISAFIEVLALRREPEVSTSFHTSSFSGLIGLTRFTNTHLESASTSLIAEGLLHEATHGMLYLYEELAGPFVRDRQHQRTAVTSTWTGATIRLQSLVHACVIWYETYWFHRRLVERGLLGEEGPERRMDLARNGFLRSPVSSALAAHASVIDPGVRDVLLRIEDHMRTI